MVFVWIVAFLVVCCVHGYAASHIAASKGYDGFEEGFWWGFFLGISGLLVVGFKPDKRQTSAAVQPQIPSESPSTTAYSQSAAADPHPTPSTWKCVCGKVNNQNSQFCFSCRRSKSEAFAKIADQNIKCKHCGANNSQGKEFCFACNQPLNKD